MATPDSLRAVRAAVLEELSKLDPSWHDDGTRWIGPGTLAVQLAIETHASAPGHVDIGFVLNRERAILGCSNGDDDASELQRWCLDHPAIPAIHDELGRALSPAACTP